MQQSLKPAEWRAASSDGGNVDTLLLAKALEAQSEAIEQSQGMPLVVAGGAGDARASGSSGPQHFDISGDGPVVVHMSDVDSEPATESENVPLLDI